MKKYIDASHSYAHRDIDTAALPTTFRFITHDTTLQQVIDQLGSEDMLLYASDYPHQHAAEPESALLRHLPAPLAQKIRGDNARAWYRL